MFEISKKNSSFKLLNIFLGNSICVASERLAQATALMKLNQNCNPKTNTDNLDMLEYPFLTMCKFPSGFILHLGSTVAARSVKLLERVPNPDEPEIRDSWWTELRMEIRSHARALGCNVVLGYSEETTISDDVCVLSATGTAAVINMSYNIETSQNDLNVPGKMVFSLDEKDMFKEIKNEVNIFLYFFLRFKINLITGYSHKRYVFLLHWTQQDVATKSNKYKRMCA